MLAAALAERDGIRVKFEGTEAYTAGKNIVIPMLPLDSDATVIATVRGHIDLQSAHIRYSDSRAVARALKIIRGVSVGISVFPATGGTTVGIFPLVRHDERVSDAFDMEGEGAPP